jgi:tetratricopeptide (TPR) repeat protein
MGIRSSLGIGSDSEIEASNCIPITWLVLFGPNDFVVETSREGHEKYQVALFRSTVERSNHRLDESIKLLQTNDSVWRYLRPLEKLMELVDSYHDDTEVILDATQFWSYDKSMRRRLENAVQNFGKFADELTGEIDKDLNSLNHLIGLYNLTSFSSIQEVPTSSLNFILFGDYYGKDESLYSSEALNLEYWSDDSERVKQVVFQSNEGDLELEFKEIELDKIEQSLKYYLKPPHAGWKYLSAAECYTQLSDYENALNHFRLATDTFLKSHKSVILPSSLIHSYALSHQPRRHKRVGKKISSLVVDSQQLHPNERYVLIVHAFLSKKDLEVDKHINELINFPGDDFYQVLGNSFVAILNSEERKLRDALIFLLKKHQNEMNSGIIRDIYLCLDAMVISLISAFRGVEVHVKSKYYSEGYIKYLISERSRPKGFLSRITTRSI